MDVRSLQRPLKERYRSDPGASRVTLRATGSQAGGPGRRGETNIFLADWSE